MSPSNNWGANSTKIGVYPIFSSSRRKPTSNMVNLSHPQGRAKFTFNEIVLTPYPTKSDVKGSNMSQGKIVRMSHCPESGYFYEVRLPDPSVEALGQM